MSGHPEPQIQTWLDQWRDGTLLEEDQAAMEQWLKADPSHMPQFVAAAAREQLLCEIAREELLSDEVRGMATIPADVVPHTGRRRTMAALLATVAVITMVVWFRRPAGPNPGPQPPMVRQERAFASVAFVEDSDSRLEAGDRLTAETIQFERGVVRLLFDDGVEVTLQGPVDYRLVAPGQTQLRTGVLTAAVPAGAEGFCVDTPAAQVVDLGTAFGIEQTADGLSHVVVFDGEVEVVSDSEKRLLTEGETLQLTADGRMQAAEMATTAFEKLWPAASGIRGSSGAFEFAPQWPRRLNRVESDSRIFVLPEGYARALPEDCPVDLASPPGAAVGAAQTAGVIAAGQRVRSFLLQFNPVNAGTVGPGGGRPFGNRRNGRRITGRITFERPVLGLIVETNTLVATDELFSFSRGGGLFGRGLEMGAPRIADVVTLSDDRSTLTLDLFVVDRLSDHVRVIVDASLYDDRALAANLSQ